jgi:hypothetical protein
VLPIVLYNGQPRWSAATTRVPSIEPPSITIRSSAAPA